MRRILRPEVVREVQLKALSAGGSIRQFQRTHVGPKGLNSRTVEWDISGNCQQPVKIELHGRHAKGNDKMLCVDEPDKFPNFVEMEVACRKCENCLKRRGHLWRLRAKAEIHDAPRTWLATLTLSPEAWTVLLSKTRVRLGRSGTDLEALPVNEQLFELDKVGFADLQLWFKRLRKIAPLRYLAVTEAHKSGLPHWHVLLHEMSPDTPLRYDTALKGSWPHGFDSYKLVSTANAAGYVTKYLTKSLGARVRASQAYGRSIAYLPSWTKLSEDAAKAAKEGDKKSPE